MNFEVCMNDFNLVSEKGYPEDGEFCWVIWKTYNGEYDFSFGGYFEDKHEFYGNCGLGGMVLDEKDVVAWKPMGEEKVIKKE